MVGLLESAEIISTEPTLSHTQATVLSSALSHDFYDNMEGEDKYFTRNEITKILSKKAERYAEHGTSISGAEAGVLLEEFKGCPEVCCCAALYIFEKKKHC
jgi:hypothetical protein